MSVCGVACLLACTVTLLFRLHCFLKKPQGQLLAVSATNRYACGASIAYNNIRCGLQHRLCGQPKASARFSFLNPQNIADVVAEMERRRCWSLICQNRHLRQK